MQKAAVREIRTARRRIKRETAKAFDIAHGKVIEFTKLSLREEIKGTEKLGWVLHAVVKMSRLIGVCKQILKE